MARSEIARATLGRLPLYLRYLKGLSSDSPNISATAIAKDLELGEVQVRKDLSAVCGAGRPKIGYDVAALCESIEHALGTHTECEAVIIGAGKLGMALLGFSGFLEYGISISRAFDKDPAKRSSTVLPLEELSAYCRRHQVEVGIIAVPAEAAQAAADALVENGIRAIWCFAAEKLSVPEGVIVQYENLALSLAHLHQKVKGTY